MSRIAPLQPPYAPDIQAQFDRIMRGAPPLMLFRVIAGQCARLGEVSGRQPAGSGSAVAAGARDRDRPDLRADRMRV